jgi:hypothetical protein
VQVGGSAFLDQGFHAKGEVRFPGAIITGQLNCDGGTFENCNGRALSADGMRVGGDAFLDGKFKAKGEVRLKGVEVKEELYCLGDLEAGKYLLDQLKYGSLHVGDGSGQDAIDWVILSQTEKSDFLPSPYEQLAEFFDRSGRESDAIDVRIAKQRAMRRAGQLSLFNRAASYPLDFFTGFGWKPWKALWWGLVVIIFGWLLFQWGPGKFIPIDKTIDARPFYPFAFSVDAFIPLVELGQEAT